jgi:hypothetical protein
MESAGRSFSDRSVMERLLRGERKLEQGDGGAMGAEQGDGGKKLKQIWHL